jgi:1,4-dihydroxy-6-naphthoate synthase
VIESHIRMFVNDFSEGVGEAGRKALDFLWSLKKC